MGKPCHGVCLLAQLRSKHKHGLGCREHWIRPPELEGVEEVRRPRPQETSDGYKILIRITGSYSRGPSRTDPFFIMDTS